MSALFHFNKRERNGIFVLAFILLGITLYYLFMPWLISSQQEKNPELQQTLRELAYFHDSLNAAKPMEVQKKPANSMEYESSKEESRGKNRYRDSGVTPAVELDPFNPNEASEEEFMKLGFPKWLAGRIVNYRTKGGKFKVKSDVQRIYGFPDSLYAKVEAYIELPDTLKAKIPKLNPESREIRRTEKIYDLNKASQEELTELRGIGKAYASRIVKFKELLGGFIKKEQLMEVYGFSDSLYYSLEHRVVVEDTLAVNPIDINTVKLGELSRHPYFTFTMAKRLVEYRERKGPYQSVSQIEEAGILNPHLYAKIKPYIRVSK